MSYPINNNYNLRNITEEIEERLKKEGKVYYFPIKESQRINNRFEKASIEAKREHIKNQVLSRRKSTEIIFNA